MTALSRRALLGAASLTAPALLLSACAGQTVATIAQRVVDDVNLIATGLQAQLPALQALGLNTANLAYVTAQVQAIVTAAGGFVTTISQNTAQTIVQQIGADYLALMQALSGFTLPAGLTTALAAIGVLLPVVGTGVGIVLAAAPLHSAMTPDQARAVLAAR